MIYILDNQQAKIILNEIYKCIYVYYIWAISVIFCTNITVKDRLSGVLIKRFRIIILSIGLFILIE